jgi:DNA-binding transcriptional MerR regulator
MMDKSPDAFRTISEVADDLDLPQHVLRFWETRFGQIKPLKRGGGRRYYRRDDVDLLRGIRHLLYGQGFTIRGVQKILKEQGVRHVQALGRGEAIAPAPRPVGGETAAEEAAFLVDETRDEGSPVGEEGGWEEDLPDPPARSTLGEGLDAGTAQALRNALDELLECRRLLASLREGTGDHDPGKA